MARQHGQRRRVMKRYVVTFVGFFAVVIAVMVIVNMDSIIRYVKMRQM